MYHVFVIIKREEAASFDGGTEARISQCEGKDTWVIHGVGNITGFVIIKGKLLEGFDNMTNFFGESGDGGHTLAARLTVQRAAAVYPFIHLDNELRRAFVYPGLDNEAATMHPFIMR
ncbi:hypothetical protein HAX54_034471 [Datura stramonium]|uniref:Dirigent protein n=1 Tax=Datura stramonium TaxID=4076 RepID=A0ABS8SEB4_DATST|nr:hypothetical protein [Datura stramonium]